MGAYFLGHCVYWGWQLHRRAPKRRRRKRGGKTASGHRGRRGPTALWRVVAVSAHAIVTVTLLVVMGNVRQCQLALTATDHLATLSSAPKALTIHTLICISQNSTCYVTSRHDTTRYLAHAFWHSDLLCRSFRAARRDTLVTTSATGATCKTRVQGRRHSVDWSGHVQLTFSRSCSWDRCKSRSQDQTFTREHFCFFVAAMLEPAWRDTHDKRDTLVTTRHITTRTCRVVTCRDVTHQVEFGLYYYV